MKITCEGTRPPTWNTRKLTVLIENENEWMVWNAVAEYLSRQKGWGEKIGHNLTVALNNYGHGAF